MGPDLNFNVSEAGKLNSLQLFEQTGLVYKQPDLEIKKPVLTLDGPLIETQLIIDGEKTSVMLPIFNLNTHIIRPMMLDDYVAVETFQDDSLASKLTSEKISQLTSVGYSFNTIDNGIVGFVAEDVNSGEIAGRGYIKTWNKYNYTKPQYNVTESGGLEVMSLKSMSGNADYMVELGGWLVKPEHRGNKLGAALAYAGIEFVDRMKKEGYPADMIFATAVGQFREQDNPFQINYVQFLHDALSKKVGFKVNNHNLNYLADEGEILNSEELNSIFKELESYTIGSPRSDSIASYKILQKFAQEKPLFKETISPIKFEETKIISPSYGSNFFIANLRA